MVDIDLLVATGAPLIAFVIGLLKSAFPLGPVKEIPSRVLPLVTLAGAVAWVLVLRQSGDAEGLTVVEYSTLTVGLTTAAAGIQGIARTYFPDQLKVTRGSPQ